jgi:hypothetical protein
MPEGIGYGPGARQRGNNPTSMQGLEGMLGRRRMAGEERAGRLETGTDVRREQFDPRSFARETAQASFQDFQEGLTRGIGDLRGQQVGMGRLTTGFGQEDEDRYVQDLNRRMAQELARGAFTAAGLEQQNISGIQSAAESARIGADEALAGQMDRAQAALNERRQRRSQRLGLLGSGLGAVGGFLVGGPAGAAAGSRIGGTIAGAI